MSLLPFPVYLRMQYAQISYSKVVRLRDCRRCPETLMAISLGVSWPFSKHALHVRVYLHFCAWHGRVQIGLHVSHSVLHQVEGAGIAIAVISTVAAAVAEILAMRRGLATTNATAVGPYAGHSVIPTATIKSPVPSVDPIRQYMEGAAVAASSSTTTSTCGTHISVSTEAGRSDIVSVAAIGVTSAGFHRKKSGEQSPSNGHLGTQSVEAATAAAGVAGAVTAAGASGSASTIVALDHNGNPFGRVMSSSWHDSSFRSTAH